MGSLIIVGSGIASIGGFTLSALAHIEKANMVFYVVADPATEAFIRSKTQNSVDLYQYYDNGKNRNETYVQMAEVRKSSFNWLKIKKFNESKGYATRSPAW